MLCGNLDRRGVWGRMDTCIYMVESLCCTYETITTLLTSYAMLCAKSLQSSLTLCDPMVYSPPGSAVHGILQARILKWLAIPSSRGSSGPRDHTHVPCISCFAGGFFSAELVGFNPSRSSQSVRLGSLCYVATSNQLSILQGLFPLGNLPVCDRNCIPTTSTFSLMMFKIVLNFGTVHGVLKAGILKCFAIPFSSGPHFVRTFHHDPSILGGPTWHGS